MVKFEFRPQWKEELLCSCALGSFTLDMPMGVMSVYLPIKACWHQVAPPWAAELWDTLRQQLQAWCEEKNIPLYFC